MIPNDISRCTGRTIGGIRGKSEQECKSCLRLRAIEHDPEEAVRSYIGPQPAPCPNYIPAKETQE